MLAVWSAPNIDQIQIAFRVFVFAMQCQIHIVYIIRHRYELTFSEKT